MTNPHEHRWAIAIYVLLGLALCGMAQLIFWEEMVFGHGVLQLPFLWSYAQYALVTCLSHSLGRSAEALIWVACYCGLAIALWVLTGRKAERPWLRAILAWIVAEVAFTVIAAILAMAGVISLE